MYYSLLDRFRGAFLGGACSETLGWFWSQRSPTQDRAWPLQHLNPFFLQINPWEQEPGYFGPSGSVTRSTQQWLSQGTLDFNLDPAPSSASLLSHEAIVLALPLMLSLHADLPQFQRQWQQAVERSHPPLLALSDGVWAIAYGMAQLLTAPLQRHQLIPQTVVYLQTQCPSTAGQAILIQQLSEIQRLLEEQAALASVLAHLRTGEHRYTPLAIALYCFLSSPDDLHLSIMRAARSGQWPALTCSLTGMLAGAYGGLNSIPSHWRSSALSPSPHTMALPSPAMDVLSLADQVWATWSGIYDPTVPLEAIDRVAIAAPQILRLR